MADKKNIDVYWSFKSPWSYLATPRLVKWQEEYELQINFKQVYPIAIRTPDFFQEVNPLWFSYFGLDVRRVAEFLGLPFAQPRPGPISFELKEGRPRPAADQPHIFRLSRLGILTDELGHGLAFADRVSRLIWGGTNGWDEGDHLDLICQELGLNLEELDTRANDEHQRLDDIIETNNQALTQAGHWGVPTCVFNGQPYFGQDRLDVLVWELKQNGLQARS